jgi:hypothetical protein
LAIRRLENLAIEAATEAGSAETDIRSMGGVERSLTNPTGRTTAAELARVVKSRVKGQDEAIETMCRVVARASFGVDFRPQDHCGNRIGQGLGRGTRSCRPGRISRGCLHSATSRGLSATTIHGAG